MRDIFNRAGLKRIDKDTRFPYEKVWDFASKLIYIAIIAGICWFASFNFLPETKATESNTAKTHIANADLNRDFRRSTLSAGAPTWSPFFYSFSIACIICLYPSITKRMIKEMPNRPSMYKIGTDTV